MERKPSKHARSKSGGALAAFLRSTAASFSSSTFASRPVGGGAKPSFNHRNAFSGPMVSIVPPEARGGERRRSKQGGGGSGYRTPEASSPKVSCIGQIKRSKSKTCRAKAKKAATTTTNVAPAAPVCGMDGGACPLPPRPPARSRTKRSLVKRMFCRRSMSRSSSSSSSSRRSSGGTDLFKAKHGSSAAVAAAPAPGAAGLGQMKRFTSGRGAFQDFDWRDAGRRGSDADGDDDDYVDDGFVAFSAPLVLGGGVVASEPRKEVNLWRRRPMSPPTPLELP